MKDENRYGTYESEYGTEDRRWEEDDAPAPESPGETEEKRNGTKLHLLTAVQIFGCLAVLAAALLLRLHGGDLYAAVRGWYLDMLNDSIIAEEQVDQARRSVVGFWTWIASAGPENDAVSGISSSAVPAPSGASQAENGPSSAPGAASGAGNAAAGKAP